MVPEPGENAPGGDVRTVPLPDEAATARLGEALAAAVGARAFVALRGPLGAGKTALARALVLHRLAAAGMPGGAVPSPTFTLVNEYDAGACTIRHFDLYRLEDPDEIWEIGWEDAMADGLALVEWPERAGGFLPGDRLDITLAPTPEGGREARLAATGPLHAAMLARLAP